MITLTPHQEEIKNNVLQALRDGNKNIVITGSAGTGKTTCIRFIIEDYLPELKDNAKVAFLAPTNKAVQILIEKSSDNNYFSRREKSRLSYLTVHRALNLKRLINPVTGLITFPPDPSSKSAPFSGISLAAIDESSMLNTEIIEYLSRYTLPKIYLGDAKQLNPVNEAVSPIFDPNREGFIHFELQEIVRQAQGNPIIDLSQNLRKLKFFTDVENEIGGYRFSSNKSEAINMLISDTKNTKFLAWTNAVVNAVNTTVRKALYEKPNRIEEGETLVLNSPYGKYYTSQEIVVDTLEIINEPITCQVGKQPDWITRDFQYYLINKGENELLVVHENSDSTYLEIQREIRLRIQKKTATWIDFYDFKELFADVSYTYASTIHKAQGSTYEKVIIDMKDLRKNKNTDELNKLWYTAITRASKSILFIK
jgi:exodeoxyribonuclease-5